MVKQLYSAAIRFPKTTIALILGVTVYLAMQLPNLHWETDARVYLPKDHPAIKYDEKIDEVFGVKDSVIVGIVNEREGIFNPTTLARIAHITEKIAALPGVIADRPIDVASLSTATIFVGTKSSIGTVPLMPHVPTDEADIARLKETIYANSKLFVGNLVSSDGKAAMIRAKLKEGIDTRYKTYFEIKCQILPQETGDWSAMQECASAGGGGEWQKGKQGQSGWQQNNAGGGQTSAKQGSGGWGQQWQQGEDKGAAGNQAVGQAQNGDRIYLAGRPVIEVTSGLNAISDMWKIIPLLLAALAITLFLIFRTARSVVLPLFALGASIVWTMGIMALLNVPLYTISTMMPVILVAVSIADSVHLLSDYYDHVLHDAHCTSSEILLKVMSRLGLPIITTSITTAVGFLSLIFAEMPPFISFGLFTVLGIFISWLLTVTFIPASLSLMKPKVASYLAKRRALRVNGEQNTLTTILVRGAEVLHTNRWAAAFALLVICTVAAIGTSKLRVDSSWMSDFPKDSEVVLGNKMFNKEFNGTIFLSVVLEGDRKDIFKSPELLRRIEGLQNYVGGLPYVGGSLSIVDYIKNMNKTLHAEDEKFDVIPDSAAQIGEYLFLFSVSGRPQQLDELVDYDYRQGLVNFYIKTDHTAPLKYIIDQTRKYIDKEFANLPVEAHFASSANNSYVWSQLLIKSQISSILLSKIAILLIAILLFRSFKMGIFAVIPITITTLIVAGVAGFLSIPIDVSTTLAAGVAIGVGVDYTTHYIYRYRSELSRTGDVLLATQATIRTIGRTIVFNALVVTIGFAALFVSNFPPNIKLAYFVTSYMVVSCLAALIILPVMFAFGRAPESGQKPAHAP